MINIFKIKRKDYIFILPCMLLLAYFIYRLVDRSAIIWFFPFDFANDVSSHMARLFFLAKYGFHNIVPDWYNGLDYVLFRSYPGGWYLLTLPLYYILKNVQLTTYVSTILIYVFAFLTIFAIGKISNFSWLRSTAFFLFVYANPLAIGYFLRLGRMPESTGWLFFLITFCILLYYKDREVNNKFLILTIVLSGWFLTNLTSIIVASPILLGFFIMKGKKARIYLLIIAALTFVLTSFWSIPMLFHTLTNGCMLDTIFTRWLIGPISAHFMDKITTWTTSILYLVIFYFYWKSKNKPIKDLLFFGPSLILAVLVISRLIIFVPFFNHVFPDSFNMLFLILSIYLFLLIPFKSNFKKYITWILLFCVVLSIIISYNYTQGEVPHTQQDKDTLELMQQAEGKLVISRNAESYSRAFYSYGVIYYNITAIHGWMDLDFPAEVIKDLKTLEVPKSSEGCISFRDGLSLYNVTSVITYNDYCNVMQLCDFRLINQKNNVCLYMY